MHQLLHCLGGCRPSVIALNDLLFSYITGDENLFCYCLSVGVLSMTSLI